MLHVGRNNPGHEDVLGTRQLESSWALQYKRDQRESKKATKMIK